MIKINNYKLSPAITATWGDITGEVSNQEDLVEYINEHGKVYWGSILGNISDQEDLQNTLGSYATQSWVSSKQFATESWVSSQGYLYSKNSSGDKIMNFDTTTPAIFLRNTVSQQLNINPWLISMHGSSYGTLITPGTVGIQMGDVSSYKVAGAICDSDMSSAVLIVRDADDYLKIDCHNIYTYSGGISNTYPLSEITSKGDLSSYATQSWVQSQGYLTSHQDLSSYATQSWVSGQGYITSSALTGYATQSWVNSQNFLTSTSLTGYATEQWVGQQGYALNSDLTSLATRVATLETNYGDALNITNQILG